MEGKEEELISELEEEIKSENFNSSKYPERFIFERKNIRRYLKGWGWDKKKAKQMMLETVEWYKEFQPHKIRAKELEYHIQSGKNYHNGFDKEGRPVIYMRCSLDTPGDHYAKLKLLIYQIERGIRLIEHHKTGAEQVVWLVDMNGFNWSTSMDVGIFMKLKDALANHYPERLGVLLILNAPWVFSSFWKMISPLLSKGTVNKIVFISSKEQADVLPQYIDVESLEIGYGGKNRYKFEFETYFSNLQKEEEEWEKSLEQ